MRETRGGPDQIRASATVVVQALASCPAPQIRQIIVAEAAFLGLLANLIGLALGTLLSLILIYVINKQSFGWTIQFHWPVLVLLSALSTVYAATILAALYPARIATRLEAERIVIHFDIGMHHLDVAR